MKSLPPPDFSRVYSIWEYLRGTSREFSLNNRIYHAISLIIMAVMVYNVPFSLLLGLYKLAGATVLLLAVQYTLYHLSRFRQLSGISRTLQISLFYAFFTINYFMNSGVDGSGLFSLLTVHFVTIVIAPRRQYRIWTLVTVILVLGVLLAEYYYPDAVEYTYADKRERLIDIASTNLVYIFLSLTCLSYIVNNYISERNIARKKANTLSRLNQQQNRLISIISHDFNAPLSNINQYLRLIRHTDFNLESRKELEHELARITTDTQNLLLNLLSWSKSNMERIDINVGPVAIGDALANTLDVYTPISSDKQIRLTSTLKGDETVLADFDMLEIVLRNLISNGVKFTEERGFVKIETEELPGNKWKIKITNSGKGIDQANKDLIFKDNIIATYGTKKEKGAGIGLAICREFTEVMGGSIGFRSEPGKETEFFVILPKAPAPQVSPGAAAP